MKRMIGVVVSSLGSYCSTSLKPLGKKKTMTSSRVIWVCVCVFMFIIWGGRCVKQLPFKIPVTMMLHAKMYLTAEQPVTGVTGTICFLELSSVQYQTGPQRSQTQFGQIVVDGGGYYISKTRFISHRSITQQVCKAEIWDHMQKRRWRNLEDSKGPLYHPVSQLFLHGEDVQNSLPSSVFVNSFYSLFLSFSLHYLQMSVGGNFLIYTYAHFYKIYNTL